MPLVVVDPRPAADGARGLVVRRHRVGGRAADLCDWLGLDVPVQADGWSLSPFLRGEPPPGHWRDEAHFEWHFSNPETRLAEQVLGLPMSHCSLAVARGARTKYVQFAADPSVLPPLLFDLDEDPAQLRDRLGGPGGHEPGFEAAQRLVRWRMRNEERTLSGRLLTASGPVEARDAWR